MEDKDGPEIADAFYRYLFQTDDGNATRVPDIMQAARALHLAVKKLREEKSSFKRWVPFIHFGV